MYRVLLAEDEMLVRLLLKSSIEWSKFDMTVIADVPNGEEAWRVYKEAKPDLIITDLKMPVMGGMELISQIRAADPHTKIVILTCLEEFDIVRKALTLGVTEYILKLTMTPEEMEGVLNKVHIDLKKRPPSANLSYGVWDKSEIKETVLKNYLFRGRYSDEEFHRHIDDIGLRLQSDNLCLCVMEFDHYERIQDKFRDKRGHLIRMTMQNVMDELLAGCKRGEALYDAENRFIFLFSFEEMNDHDEINRSLRQILEYIKITIYNYFNSTVTFSISRTGNGFHRLNAMYEECLQGLQWKFFFGLGRFFHAGDDHRASLQAESGTKWLQFSKCLEGLGELHKKVIETKIAEFLESGFETKEQIYTVFLQWLHWPVAPQHSGERITELIFQYAEKLRSCETLDEMLTVYGEFLNQLSVLRKQNSLSGEVVEAIQYLDRHYREDVSLQELADVVRISPNYLSSLFKKETGMNFIDYLTHFRIEKAKELLLGTNKKAYEIIEHVGFSNQSYFSKTFKKIVGVRPSEFRKRWRPDVREEWGDENI